MSSSRSSTQGKQLAHGKRPLPGAHDLHSASAWPSWPNTIKKGKGACILNENTAEKSFRIFIWCSSSCFLYAPILTTDGALLQPVQDPGPAGAVLPPDWYVADCFQNEPIHYERLRTTPCSSPFCPLWSATIIGTLRPAMAINNMKRTLRVPLSWASPTFPC